MSQWQSKLAMDRIHQYTLLQKTSYKTVLSHYVVDFEDSETSGKPTFNLGATLFTFHSYIGFYNKRPLLYTVFHIREQ
jgi:hypothetical protein